MSDAAIGASLVLRAAGVRVRIEAPAGALRRVVGPLSALEHLDPGTEDLLVVAEPGPVPHEAVAAAGADAPSTGAWVAGKGGPWLVAPGVGVARVPPEGPLAVFGAEAATAPDAFAEHVTIPALADALRRRGVRLIHAAVLVPRGGGGAWLVPAARGGGKTTLSLSLRGRGWSLLSDDRAFLLGTPEAPAVDAWPEAPRVGDRSLFLLPPGIAPGPRDPRTAKSAVPSLTPPRLPAPLAVSGVLLPRLVDGPGGEVRPVRGARALAAVVSQAVVATDAQTASETLQFLARALASLPVLEVDTGDHPARLSIAVLSAAGFAAR